VDDSMHISEIQYAILTILNEKSRCVNDLMQILDRSRQCIRYNAERLVYYKLISPAKKGVDVVYSMTNIGLEFLKSASTEPLVTRHESGFISMRIISNGRVIYKKFKPKKPSENGE
jgi:predicted transcriptional regulator